METEPEPEPVCPFTLDPIPKEDCIQLQFQGRTFSHNIHSLLEYLMQEQELKDPLTRSPLTKDHIRAILAFAQSKQIPIVPWMVIQTRHEIKKMFKDLKDHAEAYLEQHQEREYEQYRKQLQEWLTKMEGEENLILQFLVSAPTTTTTTTTQERVLRAYQWALASSTDLWSEQPSAGLIMPISYELNVEADLPLEELRILQDVASAIGGRVRII